MEQAANQAASENAQAFRLSPLQKRLWSRPEGKLAVAQCAVRVIGGPEPAAVRRAVEEAVGRHEILRTVFRAPQGIKLPFQVVLDRLPPAWRELSLAGVPEDGVAERLRELMAEERAAAPDPESGPVLRVVLAALGPDRHAVVLTAPLLCADSRTLRNLVGEILGTDGEDAAEPLQYVDVSEWLNELYAEGSEDENSESARRFWRRQGADDDALPPLPGEQPGERSGRHGTVRLGLADRSPASGALAERHGMPLADVLLAAWQVLLWRLTGGDGMRVDVRFDGRPHEEMAGAAGLFARSLPLVQRLDPRQPFAEVVREVGEAAARLAEWQEYADWEESGADARGPAAAASFVYEEWPERRLAGGGSVELVERGAVLEPFRVELDCVRDGAGLSIALHHDPARLPERAADAMGRALSALVDAALADPTTPIGDLDLLGAEGRRRLVDAFHGGGEDAAPEAATVHGLFEERARRDPSAAAAFYEDESITYGELARRAHRLAHHLVDLGVGVEDRVAIHLERSLDLMTALLGVLEAGAAFVPLDPSFPDERLAGMLEDSGAVAMVLDGEAPSAGSGLPAVRLADLASGDRDDAPPPVAVGPENLAYVLFTSGSTGRPTGVAVEHRHLVHYVRGMIARLGLPEGASYATVTTFAADLGNTAIYPALATGGAVHLLASERASDPAALAEYFGRHRIDCLKIVPSHLAALMAHERPAELLPAARLVLGGEAPGRDLLRRLAEAAPGLTVLNHYGPTETTVGALCGAIGAVGPADPVPLGRPLPGTRVYALDARLQPVPEGVDGEVVIGGGGVSRGYLGRPAATAERFVPDPLSGVAGGRLYRTGDLARFGSDGALAFLGRRDHQINLQGFRIEPGEVETALETSPAVREAVVLARSDDGASPRLVAYAVLERGRTAAAAELREWVAGRLPAHMVPAAVVVLDALPLTANGKLDRAALPVPGRETAGERRPYLAPRNATEETLAGIWSDLLRVEAVGVHDNFFELGGDSILSIQVIARANREGLVLHPRQMFQHQTVAELAAVVGEEPAVVAEQGPVTGDVPLTPIQSWFFGRASTDPHHFNQAVFLEAAEALEPETLTGALAALLEHHDALRSVFERSEDGWRQVVRPPGEPPALTVVDLPELPDDALRRAAEETAARTQGELDLAHGPLLCAVLLRRGERSLLFLVAHHLVVDGVSWRILIEDLTTAYRSLAGGRSPELPLKTTSFRAWAERLAEHAAGDARRAEVPFWRERLARPSPPLPADVPGDPHAEDTAGSARTVETVLGAEETRELLHEAPAAYSAPIHELLLAAVALAVARWTGDDGRLIELEGHGREPLFPDLDVSRTVGWFTSHYPVHLEVDPGSDPSDAVRRIKEAVRAVPDGGIGYGLLRHLAGALGEPQEPEIVFNYLGRFEDTGDGPALLAPARLSTGPAVSPRSRRPFALEVNAAVVGGGLSLSWTYGEGRLRRETVERLASDARDALLSLVQGARSGEAEAVAPSDFPLAKLDQGALDKVLRQLSEKDG